GGGPERVGARRSGRDPERSGRGRGPRGVPDVGTPRGRRLRVRQIALDGADHAGAVLVRALVAADVARALVIAVDGGADLVHRQLVVAGPRLVALERADPGQDRRAVVVLALVGGDLRQLDLRDAGELAGDVLGGELVVARDREVVGRRDGALDLSLGARHARHLAGLASGALGLARRAAGGLG